MPYSSAQQAQIDSANAQLASAKTALDNATSDAHTKLSDLNRCNCGKGKVNKKCRPLENSVSFPDLANISDCHAPAPLDNCTTDCCSKDTCEARVNAYNTAIATYNTATTNYTTAQANLKSVLDSVGQQVANDPNVIATTNQINADAKLAIYKWSFFGILVFISLLAGAYVWIKKPEVKRWYILGGEAVAIIFLYIIFFGVKKK